MVEVCDEGDGNEDVDMIDEEVVVVVEDEVEVKVKIEKMNLGVVCDVCIVVGFM